MFLATSETDMPSLLIRRLCFLDEPHHCSAKLRPKPPEKAADATSNQHQPRYSGTLRLS